MSPDDLDSFEYWTRQEELDPWLRSQIERLISVVRELRKNNAAYVGMLAEAGEKILRHESRLEEAKQMLEEAYYCPWCQASCRVHEEGCNRDEWLKDG